MSSEEDNDEVDEFTKQRMPRMEDFLMPEDSHKKQKKPKKHNPALIDDFQEKILSLKNQRAKP